jgi:hypothetical protein
MSEQAPQIESYRFGHIVIDGQSYTGDVIVLSDRIIPNWWRREGHALYPEDLDAVFEAAPDVLVVGQGKPGRLRVHAETERALQAAGIELIALPTEKACQTYNELRRQQAVAAALHLTC